MSKTKGRNLLESALVGYPWPQEWQCHGFTGHPLWTIPKAAALVAASVFYAPLFSHIAHNMIDTAQGFTWAFNFIVVSVLGMGGIWLSLAALRSLIRIGHAAASLRTYNRARRAVSMGAFQPTWVARGDGSRGIIMVDEVSREIYVNGRFLDFGEVTGVFDGTDRNRDSGFGIRFLDSDKKHRTLWVHVSGRTLERVATRFSRALAAKPREVKPPASIHMDAPP